MDDIIVTPDSSDDLLYFDDSSIYFFASLAEQATVEDTGTSKKRRWICNITGTR